LIHINRRAPATTSTRCGGLLQPVEVGATIDAQQHSLAVNHERTVAVAQRGLGDARITRAPVVTVPSKQPHALDDQAIAVCLISWIHSGRSGTLVPRVGMQGSNVDLGIRER
jgi:hypothetical protein